MLHFFVEVEQSVQSPDEVLELFVIALAVPEVDVCFEELTARSALYAILHREYLMRLLDQFFAFL